MEGEVIVGWRASIKSGAATGFAVKWGEMVVRVSCRVWSGGRAWWKNEWWQGGGGPWVGAGASIYSPYPQK